MNQDLSMLAAVFTKSLNLGPEWTVENVEFKEVKDAKDEFHIYIVRTTGYTVQCPTCGKEVGVYDTREREWRHLDIWQFKTVIHCQVPRSDCPEHGPHTIDVPWSSDNAAHFTALFEALVLTMAMAGLTVRGISKIVGEHDTRLWRILRASVDAAREDADYSDVTAIGVDETARRRGHNYLTSFVDVPHKRVLFVTEGRDSSTLGSFVQDLKEHAGSPKKIATITCDMSPAFAAGARIYLPNASRIIDHFHVIQLFTRQLDFVRMSERKESEEKLECLKKSRYIWLKNVSNLTEKQLRRKESLYKLHLKTMRACMMKEEMQSIYECRNRTEAETRLAKLTSWMMHSRLEPMKKVARTIRRNQEEILAYFDHQYTNAILEGLNSIIQSAKRMARGYRNLEYFKTIIYLNLGKLTFGTLKSSATH